MKVMTIADRPEYGDQLAACLALCQEPWADVTFSTGTLEQGGEAAAQADSLLFLIDPERVGHAAWQQFLAQLKHRPAAILFWINELERLSAPERALVLSEVSLAVGTFTDSPKVWLGSTALALLALRPPAASDVATDLERALHSYRMVEPGGETSADALLAFSGLNTLGEHLSALSGTQNLMPALAVGERVCLVVSTRPGTGKSTVGRALSLACPGWMVAERTVPVADLAQDELIMAADAVLIVTDAAWQDDFAAALPLLGAANVWFLLNHADEFPTSGKLVAHELRDCRQRADAARVDRSRVLAGSAYLAVAALELVSGQRTVPQLITDPQVLLLDDWDLPLPKAAYRDRLPQWLQAAHGLHDLIHGLGGAPTC